MEKMILDLNRIIGPSRVCDLKNLYGHKKKLDANLDNKSADSDAEINDENTDEKYVYESLEHHIDLANDYFLKIMDKKNLSCFFDHFLSKIKEEISEHAVNEFRLMYMNVVNFHDIGKINPNFQKRLDNICKLDNEVTEISNSKHSMLSAIIYLNFFIHRLDVENKVDFITEEEKNILREFVFLGAFAIARHHSDLVDFKNFEAILCGDDSSIYDNLSSFVNTSGIAANFAELSMNFDDIKQKNIREEIENENIRLIKTEFWKKKCKCKKSNKLGRIFENLEDWKKKNIKMEDSYYIMKTVYLKMIYSFLLASDYYATTEFMNGVKTEHFGELENFEHIFSEYNDTDIQKSIRKYEKEKFGNIDLSLSADINDLRNDMFLNSERTMLSNMDKNMFFLEAPTGAGKSNMAMNLSMQLIDKNEGFGRIYYTYPFNTLIEQNKQTLYDTFANKDDVLDQIAVVNSVTPYKKKTSSEIDDNENYNRTYLDRIFMNYPIILNSHVNLFNIIFGYEKESAFSFFQLYGSVIVLDEIQSYKFSIWTEIFRYFEVFADLMNIKFIIMSATLPDFSIIMKEKNICRLISDSKVYFKNPLFKDRVKINYDLLEYESDEVLDKLSEKIEKHITESSRIMVEFINKKNANDFYQSLLEKDMNAEILLMTGDDSILERNRVIKKIKRSDNKHIVLIATQVVEAGVDIDMDVGFKDISKLDSEEQFMGRINRSCKRSGLVYFFNNYKAKNIYRNDERLSSELTLLDEESRKLLLEKDFMTYYTEVLAKLKRNVNETTAEKGIEWFYKILENMEFVKLAERMKLIDENNKFAIFFSREIEMGKNEGIFEGTLLGDVIWDRYVFLLKNNDMEYTKKKVLLAEVRTYMDNFIFEVKQPDIPYNAIIGKYGSKSSIMYVKDGYKYIENGKLKTDAFKKDSVVFI